MPAFSTMNGTVNMPAMAGAMLVTLCISTPGRLMTPFFRRPSCGVTSAEVVDGVMALPP